MAEEKITSATLAEAQTWIGRACTCYDLDGNCQDRFTIKSVDRDCDGDIVMYSKGARWYLAGGDYIVLEPEAPTLKSLRAQRAELDEQIEDLERVAAETEGLPEGWRWPSPKRKRHILGPGGARIDTSLAPRGNVSVREAGGRDVWVPVDALAAVIDAYRANNPDEA